MTIRGSESMADGVKFIDPLGDKSNTLNYNNADNSTKQIEFENLNKILAGNKVFTREDIDWYNKFSRYGYIDPYHTDQISREFLFFTKPDLLLFGSNKDTTVKYNSSLNEKLANIPFFHDSNNRCGEAMRQLQYSVKDKNDKLNPFMYLLSNAVTSKLDLPSISSESKESTSNILGTSIQYRGHSYKSDNGYDFSLSFTDTYKLEVYTLLKVYDEYMRLLKTGEADIKRTYIENMILPEQFSIYKFLIGSDGETILFYSKLTGCYFTDVPRSDLSDPGPDGIKFSASLHAQFVEDSNPAILAEFNQVASIIKASSEVGPYDYDNNIVDNTWVRRPEIVRVKYDKRSSTDTDVRVKHDDTNYNYRMKWFV
jgi:hypothetical protein